MKLVIRLGVLFYMMLILFLGCFMVLFVLNIVHLQGVLDLLTEVYENLEVRSIVGAVGLFILLNNYVFARAILSQQQRGKMIAFDNPGGRVSVSLAALEDLVRREMARAPEVKEVRCTVFAARKAIEINARLILNADVNIPEMTSRLQDMVKGKVQDTIGIEENVVVKIDVVKIIPDAHRAKKQKEHEETVKPLESAVPFQGYRP